MSYKYTNDSVLLKDIKEGNHQAFKYLFELFYPDLFRYIRNFVADSASAEDIVQEALIGFWNKKEGIEIKASLKSYLFRTCYNKYLDSYREEKKMQKKLEEFRYYTVKSLLEEDKSFQEEKLVALDLEIKRLPRKCQEVFLFCKVEGLKYKEVALLMNISVKTVENHVGNALERLRSALKKELLKKE